MKTKYVVLGLILVLAAGGLWVGRVAWRVRHQLVTLRVRNVPLAEVLKSVERQTRTKIRAEQGLDTRITLRVSSKPLAYVLDRLAEQAGGRWSTLYAVYDSPKSLTSLDSALTADGKLETVGWTKLAPSPPELKEPENLTALPPPGADLQVQPLPPRFAPGRAVTTTEDVVAGGPVSAGSPKPGSMPKMFRVVRGGGPDGKAVVEQEVWSPVELVIESALKDRLGKENPEDASPSIAAQVAKKVNGHWTTLYSFRKSAFGFSFGGLPRPLSLAGEARLGPPMANSNPLGASTNPGAPPGFPPDLGDVATRERNDHFARLTAEQRVQQARARQGFEEK
jgi:hypothetical protein